MYFLSISFWEQLVKLDRGLFKKINSDWANPFFDAVMPFLRKPLHWIPLYMFVLVFVLANFKVKALWWIVFFITTVALTDMTGTYIFKHEFERLRPCNDPDFFEQVRQVLKQCAGGYSFISNHAANHFGMAVFFLVTFRHILKKWAWVGILWAFLIAYAQVYIGIHYPFDVFCGALLGLGFGLATGTFFNKRFGFAIFGAQPVA